MFKLKDIASVLSGLPGGSAAEGEARFVRLADLGDMVAGAPVNLAHGARPTVARATPIDAADILVAARGASTIATSPTSDVIGAYISLDLYLIRPDQSRIDPAYLRAVLQLPSTQTAFSGARQGSNLQRLPKDALEDLLIPLPPLHRQKMIAELSGAFDDEVRILSQLRDRYSLLARETLQMAITNFQDSGRP